MAAASAVYLDEPFKAEDDAAEKMAKKCCRTHCAGFSRDRVNRLLGIEPVSAYSEEQHLLLGVAQLISVK